MTADERDAARFRWLASRDPRDRLAQPYFDGVWWVVPAQRGPYSVHSASGWEVVQTYWAGDTFHATLGEAVDAMMARDGQPT